MLTIAACSEERAGPAAESTTLTIESTAAPATVPAPDPPESTVISDVIYDEDPRRQILDVHVPAGDGPFPTILAIHGGRFSMKARASTSSTPTTSPNAASRSSRRTTGSPRPTRGPPRSKTSTALAWIHANAEEYGFDPTRIFVLGGSAGGTSLRCSARSTTGPLP